MNAAQIDQTLEKLMFELQGFKRSRDLLTDAGTKAEEVIAAAQAIIQLAEQVQKDNQRQVEAVQNYTAKSEQGLAALVASANDGLSRQSEELTAFEKTVQGQIKALTVQLNTSQKQQEEAIGKLKRTILEQMQEQNRVQRRNMWILFTLVLITLASIYYIN
jgi:hypothetical protein